MAYTSNTTVYIQSIKTGYSAPSDFHSITPVAEVDGLPTGDIIGIVLGALGGLVAVAVLALLCILRRRRKLLSLYRVSCFLLPTRET
jgi:hypothetical protein